MEKTLYYLLLILTAVLLGLSFAAVDQEQSKAMKFFFICLGMVSIFILGKSTTKV